MSTLYSKLNTDWRKHFLMYEALSIIVSTCIGSIAVYGIFQHGNGWFQMVQVFLVVVACNALNASILTVQKPKTVLNALIFSLVVCTLVAIFNFSY